MDTVTFTISSTLSISINDGEYGRYIKIHRKQRWIALSASLWNIIKEKMEFLRSHGYVLHLTKTKRLEVITFEGRRYVSFLEQKVGSPFKSIINLNDDEWAILQKEMDHISNALIECKLCNNLKRSIIIQKDKRIADSTLNKKKVEELKKYNLTVQNQLGMRCLYCGVESRDDCHCHEFDCEVCEPQNFCLQCHAMTVYSAI
jgi:hypothetical protein